MTDADVPMRRGGRCDDEVPFDRFVTASGNLVKNCKWCRSVINRAKNLKTRYGITEDQYLDMLRRQQGRCAICDLRHLDHDGPLVVDHCHTTLEIRGLLCDACNTSLGKMGDSPERLIRASDYLQTAHTGLFTPRR